MPDAAATAAPPQSTPSRKTPGAPEKKYKCQFCNRAFSRSEHRSRHERSREFKFPTLVHSGVEGWWGHPFISPSMLALHSYFTSCTTNTILFAMQTPKNGPSNAQSVEAPLCDGIYYCDTIGPSMPKMEECPSSAKSSVVQPPNQLRPRPPPPSGTWSWTRQRWNK